MTTWVWEGLLLLAVTASAEGLTGDLPMQHLRAQAPSAGGTGCAHELIFMKVRV